MVLFNRKRAILALFVLSILILFQCEQNLPEEYQEEDYFMTVLDTTACYYLNLHDSLGVKLSASPLNIFTGSSVGVPDSNWVLFADTAWVTDLTANKIRVPDSRWTILPDRNWIEISDTTKVRLSDGSWYMYADTSVVSNPGGDLVFIPENNWGIIPDGNWNVVSDDGAVNVFNADFVSLLIQSIIDSIHTAILDTIESPEFIITFENYGDTLIAPKSNEQWGYFIFDNDDVDREIIFYSNNHTKTIIWELNDNSIGDVLTGIKTIPSETIAFCSAINTRYVYTLSGDRFLVYYSPIGRKMVILNDL